MTKPPLIEQIAFDQMLEHGRASAAGRHLDPAPVVKLFTPDAGATWLLTEIDPIDHDRAFGLCDLGLGEPELGYVSLRELEQLRGGLGLSVEIDAAFSPIHALSTYAEAARTAGRIIEQVDMAPSQVKWHFHVGQRVFFWTGRGSQGFGTIRAIKSERAFIDPEPDATKGSDFRTLSPGLVRKDVWVPRDYGVRFDHLNTSPQPWFQNS